jgi:tRNA dimethylallyltransferase
MGTPVIAVVGATATGKSGLATELARALGGEVVNADSMQLYQGMDIGTAKEPVAARRGVPHHLLGIWPVTQTANVADYAKLARAAIDDIIALALVPVLAGGSGLYVRAALDDLDFPGTDPGIRARLEEELARAGAAALHARLAALDPDAAGAILPGNGRRIVRALEVIELSGRPFTATMPAYQENRPAVQLGLALPRPELDRRIAARVDRMWQAGLEAEVRSLAAQGLRAGQTARTRNRRLRVALGWLTST